MIGVEGSWILDLEAEGIDGLSPLDIGTWKLVEEVGNQLPTFEGVVSIRDVRKSRRGLFPGAKIKLGLGRDSKSIISNTYRIVKTEIVEKGQVPAILIQGVLDVVGFVAEERSSGYVDKTSNEVVRQVAAEWFEVDMKAASTQDRQLWLMGGNTPQKFLNTLWLHGNSQGLNIPAITIENIYRYYDVLRNDTMRDLGSNSNNTVEGGLIMDPYMGEVFYGGGASWSERKEEQGTVRTAKAGVSSTLGAGGRVRRSKILGDNTHPQYWEAFYKNLGKIAKGMERYVTVRMAPREREPKMLDGVKFTRFLDSGSANFWVARTTRVIKEESYFMYVALTTEGE